MSRRRNDRQESRQSIIRRVPFPIHAVFIRIDRLLEFGLRLAGEHSQNTEQRFGSLQRELREEKQRQIAEYCTVSLQTERYRGDSASR